MDDYLYVAKSLDLRFLYSDHQKSNMTIIRRPNYTGSYMQLLRGAMGISRITMEAIGLVQSNEHRPRQAAKLIMTNRMHSYIFML